MDPCQDLADLVAQLQKEVNNLILALADPNNSPEERASLSGQLFQARHNLAAARGALLKCRQNPPPPPKFPNRTYLKASNTRNHSDFGYSVAVSGDTIVVGAFGESSNATGVDGNQDDTSAGAAGAAYVFVRIRGVWSQQAYLKASNTDAGDGFGISVAVSGDTVVVGAFGESSNATGVNGDQADNSAPGAGAAYVFVRSGTMWTQQAYLKASNTDQRDFFGYSVAVSGATAVVGAIRESSNATGVNGSQTDNSALAAGAAYVFLRNGNVWTQQAYLKASNTDTGDSFGRSVAVSGDTIVVGADGEASSATGVNGNQTDNSALAAGAAYVFIRNGTIWSQQAYLKASNTDGLDFFGHSVAISGDTVIVGAILESSSASGVDGNQADNSFRAAGAAYVFVRVPLHNRLLARLSVINQSLSSVFIDSFWIQEAYLKASNPAPQSRFGESVGVSGDMAVVGAYQEFNDSGAAYVFVRVRGQLPLWSPYESLNASNADPGDEFGQSMSVSSGTVAVGAPGEASNATGVNGNQADNSDPLAGATYVFSG